MASGNGGLASMLAHVQGKMSNPVIAAALLLAGVFFNYYLSTQKIQDQGAAIQQQAEDIKKLKAESLTREEFNRAQQQAREDAVRAQQNQIDAFRSLGDKIDRVNSRIDLILEHESARRAGH